ncbi:hypothetical protein FQN57_006762 [Myotisia sp. PD_48]|nr:hypothetical protein FQN57_006762 [Myotisia sp. PD_48]
MGKGRNRDQPVVKQRMKNFSKLSTKPIKQPQANKSRNGHHQQKHNKPMIPIRPSDRVLLIGEGDFSYALSLATHHHCRHRLLATCYDTEEKLFEKYPQAKQHIQQLCDLSVSNKGKSGALKRKREQDDERGRDDEETHTDKQKPTSPLTTTPASASKPTLSSPTVLFGIDAKKLGSTGGGGKLIRNGFPRGLDAKSRKSTTELTHGSDHNPRKDRKSSNTITGGPWDVICFNFPHVGGISTDVNRQVRANQELLVAFFKACVPLLSVPNLDTDEEPSYSYGSDGNGSCYGSDDSEHGSGDDEHSTATEAIRKEPGQIIITLFEGEPYTLWNIRDLARHAGFRVVTSFKFPWASYPGYSHARTLGTIEGKDGGRGGWKGEDREARSYVFERKDFEHLNAKVGKKKRKGKEGSDGDSD